MRKFAILTFAILSGIFVCSAKAEPLNSSVQATISQKSADTTSTENKNRDEKIRKELLENEHGAERIIGVRGIDSKQRQSAFDLKVKLHRTLKKISDKIPLLESIFRTKVFGIPFGAIIAGFFVIVFAWSFQRYIAVGIFKLASKIFDRVKVSVMRRLFDALLLPTKVLIMLVGIEISLLLILRSPAYIVILGRIFWGVFYVVIFWAIWKLLSLFFDVMSDRIVSSHKGAINILDLGRRITKFALILFGCLVALDMCGANIGAIVASLGIGGAALAFASKDTIANFFGSVSLVADKPFVVGDWIIADSIEGTVESIGIRSTKIRTFPKTLVTIPNSVLANVAIDNWSNMNVRRVTMTLGFTYSSSPDQLLGIVKDIEKLLGENNEVDKGSFVVNFTEFADSSLNIFVMYYCKRVDLKSYNAIRQQVNLDIMEAASKRGLSFAFPSRSIYVENPVNILGDKSRS